MVNTSGRFAAVSGGGRKQMPRFTKGGKKTAVADVEDKLKKEYPGNPGAVYGTLNKIGLKKGSRTTAKGMKAAKPKMGHKMGHKGGGDEAMLKKHRMPR
jgi:hypothetical protein